MKIVVRGTNWVGDAVMQIPALRRLRGQFADAHITLATRSWARGIFEDADFLDEILMCSKSDSVFKQAKMWREKNFDLAIIFTNSFESALVARLGGAKRRLGYATEARSFLLTDSVAVPDWKNSRHEVFYYLNLIANLEKDAVSDSEVFNFPLDSTLGISEERKTQARNFLAEFDIDSNKKLVAFCPGSTNSRAKRWQAESYAKLNDLLQKDLNAQVILIGAEDETEVSEKVFNVAELKPILLTGKTTLAEATAILSVCDLLVSNDTGPAHIASALGTKTFVIFGPTNPLTTHPLNAEIIRREVECSPCMLRDCPIDHRCMTAVSPQSVYEKIRKEFSSEM